VASGGGAGWPRRAAGVPPAHKPPRPPAPRVGAAPAASALPPARVASNEVVQSAWLFETAVEAPWEPYGPPMRIIDTSKALEELVRELHDAPSGFVVDTETTSEEPMRAGLVGVGVTAGGRPAYLPIAHRE